MCTAFRLYAVTHNMYLMRCDMYKCKNFCDGSIGCDGCRGCGDCSGCSGCDGYRATSPCRERVEGDD